MVGEDIGLFIKLVPKFLLIRKLILWGHLINFDWLVHKIECLNVSTTKCILQKG